ncbi:UNVERIFIED_CONTAM: Two-pore potassium channel 1 [Sesamum calycinum]|uniref:Two-pore potassium channel 1 n=1 Tax=Sesamum calycinum TaxID=2727403 RepID=A0AAW2Q5P3_9LAMI
MAKSDAEDPLLENSVESSRFSARNTALMKRRYSRCKSVPGYEGNPDQNNSAPHQHPETIFANKLDFKLVFLILLAYVSVGAFCFFLVRYQIKGNKTNGFIDAIYFCIVTMTTVGYGDLVPDSTMAKLLACVFVFMGMALIGLLLSKAADSILENQEAFLVRAIHMREKSSPAEILKEAETNRGKYKFYTVLISLLILMIFFYCLAELYTERRRKSLVKWVLTRKLTASDLESADNNDNVVNPAEFVVYKLKEMGKISEEDIRMVMEWFKILDVDQSGTLTKS